MRHIEDLLAPECHAELVGREQEQTTLQRLLRILLGVTSMRDINVDQWPRRA